MSDSTNCRHCAHHRVERHIQPQIVVCTLLDGQIGCRSCFGFADIQDWKFSGGEIRCPGCSALNPIPRADNWRMGCCGLQSETVIVPLTGMTHCICDDFAPLPQASVPSPPARTAAQRSLF